MISEKEVIALVKQDDAAVLSSLAKSSTRDLQEAHEALTDKEAMTGRLTVAQRVLMRVFGFSIEKQRLRFVRLIRQLLASR